MGGPIDMEQMDVNQSVITMSVTFVWPWWGGVDVSDRDLLTSNVGVW